MTTTSATATGRRTVRHTGDLLIQLAIDLPPQDEALHQFAESWDGGGNPRASLGV